MTQEGRCERATKAHGRHRPVKLKLSKLFLTRAHLMPFEKCRFNISYVLIAAPESLTIFCRSILDAGRSRFLCPYISQDQPPVYCGVEWDYIDVRRLAVLTDAEIREFERKISQNYLIKARGVQECPKCKSMVQKTNKKHIRVICPLCSKKQPQAYEFCWHCLHEWANDSSMDKCGKFSVPDQYPRLLMSFVR